MNFTTKLHNKICSFDLFFILIGTVILFLGFLTKFRVFSRSANGASVCFLFSLASIIVSNICFFENEFKLKKIIKVTTYLLFFLSFVFLFFLLFYFFNPAHHEAKWLMPIMSLVLLFLGVHTSVTDNFLLFVYSGKTYRFAISYEQFAFSFFMLISLTLFFYHIIKSKRIKIFTTQLLITVFYFICRYIVLIFIFMYVNDIGIFYEPFYLIVSILPLCLILSVHNRKKSTNYKNISIFANFKLNLLTAFLFSLTVSFFVYAIFLFDGTDAEKAGQIYIDEYHSDGWEAIFEPLNTENFGGQKSTYTYFSFVRMLEKIKPVRVITKSDDYENISAEDILIIKTPTVDFTEEEMKKIDSILKKGAGVWIIGDHTNLLDMSSRLNKIIEPYGARFNYDAVYDLATSNLTYFDNTLLPLFKHRINSVLSGYKFATSCSIKTSPLYHKIMIANNACSEYLDLSHQNYFGDLSFSEEEYFGLFCQCAAKKVGKGRLLIYSDSTTLSSFSIFMHTNPEFVFSSISYLNKKILLITRLYYRVYFYCFRFFFCYIHVKQEAGKI